MSRRYVFRYASASCFAPTTRIRRSVATGGMAAPLPSKITRSGARAAASRAPADDVRDRDGAGQPAARASAADRRHPGDGRRLEVVRRGMAPRARSARRAPGRSAAVRSAPARAGPPRPIATTITERSRWSSRARWPVTAVFPTRLPVPITAIDGSANASSCGGSKRKSAPTYGRPAASARETQRNRSAGPSTGSSDRSTTTSAPAKPVDQRHAVVGRLAQLLGAADEDHPDPVVRKGRERVPHDRRVVLSVDQRDRAHPLTSVR